MPDRPEQLPAQKQDTQPGHETEMAPSPQSRAGHYRGSGKLDGRVALITGGDSGIGRSVAVHFAREGADLAIVYLNEHDDAHETQRMVEDEGRSCLLLPGDVTSRAFCFDAVKRTVAQYGRLDVLVNNAAKQYVQESIEDITEYQLDETFRTNIYAMFFMTQAAMPHFKEGSCIVNTTSITAYQGNPVLLDYSATKGAIVSFTRALAANLASRGIRVNAVAPGPIWTPLIPATFEPDKVASFGQDTPLGRPGQPDEVAPAFVFLASEDASYISGQTIHPNGGQPVGG